MVLLGNRKKSNRAIQLIVAMAGASDDSIQYDLFHTLNEIAQANVVAQVRTKLP